MVTGDNKVTATETARVLGMDWALIESVQGLPVSVRPLSDCVGFNCLNTSAPQKGFSEFLSRLNL
jgi:hypothetical protein